MKTQKDLLKTKDCLYRLAANAKLLPDTYVSLLKNTYVYNTEQYL